MKITSYNLIQACGVDEHWDNEEGIALEFDRIQGVNV
jgi:hypothetical protein